MQFQNELPEKKALRQRNYCLERHGEADVQAGHQVKSAWKWGVCKSKRGTAGEGQAVGVGPR